MLFCAFMYCKYSVIVHVKEACVGLWISCTEQEGGSGGNRTPWFVMEEGTVGGGNQGGATNPLAAALPSREGGGSPV